MNLNLLISEFLIYSWTYYETNVSLISDKEFDEISTILLDNFVDLQKSNHIHKNLIDKDMLIGTTAFNLIGKFPTSVKLCAKEMIYKNTNSKQYKQWWITEKKVENKNLNDLF